VAAQLRIGEKGYGLLYSCTHTSHKREEKGLILLIGCFPSCFQVAQDSTDQYMAISDADSGSTVNIQNLTTKLNPARQSDRSASGKALDIIVGFDDSEIEIDSREIAVRDDSDTTSQPQACISDVFQSPHLTATIDTMAYHNTII
jgi:hypothetical protein